MHKPLVARYHAKAPSRGRQPSRCLREGQARDRRSGFENHEEWRVWMKVATMHED
jgi:hypothetical protein